ncbi:phage head-tail connector protein [Bradyrhizobium sp. USDA 3256]
MITVTVASSEVSLTRLDTVKSELGIVGRDQDDKLKKLIGQASGIVASYCNRVFALETVQETFRVRCGSNGLTTGRYPITEISSIVENDVQLTADDFEADLEAGLIERLRSGCVVRWPQGKVVVIYAAGYELPSAVPPPVERATIELVKQFYVSGDRDPLVRSETVEGAGSTDYFAPFSGGFTPEVEALLAPYRKFSNA